MAAVIGPVSAWLFTLNSIRIFSEYILLPRIKAADGYLYPQWRYVIFDAVLIPWCVVGIIAAVLLFRAVVRGDSINGWAARCTLAYFVGFAVLVAGVMIGMWMRSIGV